MGQRARRVVGGVYRRRVHWHGHGHGQGHGQGQRHGQRQGRRCGQRAGVSGEGYRSEAHNVRLLPGREGFVDIHAIYIHIGAHLVVVHSALAEHITHFCAHFCATVPAMRHCAASQPRTNVILSFLFLIGAAHLLFIPRFFYVQPLVTSRPACRHRPSLHNRMPHTRGPVPPRLL